jgi:hypothetical protein
MQNKQENYKE